MIFILLLPLFIYLSIQIFANYYAVNLPVFQFINSLPIGTDFFWQNLTFLGDGLPAFVILLLFSRENARLLWLGVLAAVLTGLEVQVIKHVMDIARPAAILQSTDIHIIGSELRRHSFPSGHSATAFVLAGLIYQHLASHWAYQYSYVFFWRPVLLRRFALPAIGLTTKQSMGIFVLLMASLVAWSRVKVGAHWPVDVVLGALLGWYTIPWVNYFARLSPLVGYGRTSSSLLYLLGTGCAIKLWTFTGGYKDAAFLAHALSAMALLTLVLILLERQGVTRWLLLRTQDFRGA